VPCLTDEEVLELAKLGKRVHEHYGRAQDIEWAIDADLKFPDSVFLVQSRPETVWSSRKAEPAFKGKTVEDLIGPGNLSERCLNSQSSARLDLHEAEGEG